MNFPVYAPKYCRLYLPERYCLPPGGRRRHFHISKPCVEVFCLCVKGIITDKKQRPIQDPLSFFLQSSYMHGAGSPSTAAKSFKNFFVYARENVKKPALKDGGVFLQFRIRFEIGRLCH